MDILAGIEARFKRLRGVLDERSRRLLVAAESEAMGGRRISTVSKATGVSRQVIRQGIAELKESAVLPERRIRRSGSGRKSAMDDIRYTDFERLAKSHENLPHSIGCGSDRGLGSARRVRDVRKQ